MRAIILTAGRSKRMIPLTNDFPKCLLPFGEKTILDYQLDLLRENGVSDIVVVNGFAAEKVKKVGGEDITYIYNKDYLATNSIYSLYLAKDCLDSNCILLNSDVIISRKLMKLLLEEEFASGTFVNFQKELIDGEMNVKVCNGFVSEIGKDIPAKEADGESVQICKFNKASAQILKDEIIKLVNNNMIDKFPAYAFKAVIERNGLKGIDTQGHIWFEIDVHDDYKHVMK